MNPGFGFDASTKQFKVKPKHKASWHMTLGINEVTSKEGRAIRKTILKVGYAFLEGIAVLDR